jgi:hypothetical protein
LADSAAWRNIPTSILDLSQKPQDAETWAAGQRAQLAETWANVQRQAVQTMADTWQKGTDSLDHFQAGYGGNNATSPAPSPTGMVPQSAGIGSLPGQDAASNSGEVRPGFGPGYNDVAGATSGASPAFGTNPEDVTSPIEQARASGTGTQLLPGNQPLTDLANATGIPQQVQRNWQNIHYRSNPTLGTRTDQPAREQAANSGFNKGFTRSQVYAQQNAATEMALGTVGEIPEGAGKALEPLVNAAEKAAAPIVESAARAGNILLRKFDPGIQDVIDEAASTNPNLMEEARRGVVSDATVQQLADAAGTTVQKVIDRWKPGQAANAETIQVLRTALDSQARKVLDAQKVIQAGDNSTASQLKFQLAIKEHLAVQQAVSGVTAEAGRGLRVLRQSVQQALQSNDVSQMQGLLKKLGGAEWTDELSQKLSQIDTSDPTQVATFLRDIGKAKAPDYINEWLYNAILSNPSTHIANSVSNTINALMGPVERYASAAVEAPLSAIQGRPRERFFGEGTANAYGLLQGLPEGIRAGTYALQHGFSELSAMKGEMPRPQAFKGPVGNAINIPSRFLTVADAFFQPIMQRGAVNAEIFRKAAREGLTGQAFKSRIAELTADVPPDLMERAGKMAEYQLYRQEPGKFGAWLSKGRDTLKIGPVEPLRFVLPFVQVPVNATKYGLERSPLGFLNPDLWKNLAKQSPEAADQLARIGIGSLITASIASQVASGNLDITGAVPQSPSEKDAFYRQGKLPFALKIGGKWYSYQRWEPFNHALTQVAAGVDAIRNAKAGADPTSIAGQAALTIGQNVTTQTFLSGIGSLINAATDPQRYGESFIAQLETSMVPASSAARAVANTLDPRQRSPQGIVENVKNVIPGLSQQVPSRLNNYGEEQPIAGSPFLPYKSQTANDSPLEMELARLKVEPGAAGKSVRGIDLTRQENQDYQRLSGGLVKAALTQVLNDPRYRQLDDTGKAAALTRIISHAKDLAATRFINQLAASQGKDAILQRIAAKKRAALPKAG